MDAAGKVSALAVGDPEIGPASETFRIRQDASQDDAHRGHAARHRRRHPREGRRCRSTASTCCRSRCSAPTLASCAASSTSTSRVHSGRRARAPSRDGRRSRLQGQPRQHDQGGRRGGRARTRALAAQGGSARRSPQRSSSGAQRRIRTRLQPFIRSSTDTRDTSGHPHFDTFTITGPFNATGPGDTPSRRRIFICQPDDTRRGRPVRPHASSRRSRAAPIAAMSTGATSQRLLEFYQAGRRDGTFETGIQMALQRMLASPKFVFRVERDPAASPPAAVYRSSDLELASRLSFFLWSSIPDDELLRRGAPGQLHDAGGARTAGAAHAGRSEVRGAGRPTSPANGCTCAT